MADHPTSFRGDGVVSTDIEWEDRASLHRLGYGSGLFSGMTVLSRGTLREMIRLVMRMPEDRRGEYVIQKKGDRRFDYADIRALYARDDFPTG